MKHVLQKQYELLQGSREIVFKFLETTVRDDLNKPVAAYENQTIRFLLWHGASCYFYWLSYYSLQQPEDSSSHLDCTTVNLTRWQYKKVDDLVALFLNSYEDKMEEPISGAYSGNPGESATPLQLFTHVLTHEFHHKGQIMLMSRMLGHIPPDTDVSNFFNRVG